MRSGMQHRHGRGSLRRVGLLASGFGAAGCDGSDRVMLAPADAAPGAPPANAPGAIEPDLEAPAIAGFDAVGACAVELPACEGGSNVACTLRCGARPNGCIAYSEYVPLAINEDEAYSLLWGPIDPEGRWAFHRRELSRGRRESTLYRWSVEAGDVALADLLGLPAASPEVYEALSIVEVGAAGDPILLLGFDDDVANHGYVWTREAGLARLDFVPWDMSADGHVVVGTRAGRAVVWGREAGVRRLDGAALDAPPLIVPGVVPDDLTRLTSVRWIRVSDSGERVLSVENSGRGFRWSEARGVVPLAEQIGFPQDASVELADLETGAIVASRARSEREPLRLWWWDDAEGARELGTLPDQASSYRRAASLLRAGGDVIIGDEASSYGDVAVFRWTAELGTERVSPPATLSVPSYANADGTTIVGTVSVGVQSSTFRWTARGGVSRIPDGGGTSLIALGGDVLIAPPGVDGEPSLHRVLKFDQALEASDALPIDLIAAGSVADRDAVEQAVHLVSENARLLVGTLRNRRGVSRAWALRLRDTCGSP
jgi:hypothetical protein